MAGRERIVGEAGAVIVDTRHLPIVVVLWTGVLDVGMVERFGAWLDCVLASVEGESSKLALISDLTRSEPPSGEVRRALVELRERSIRRSREVFALELVVIDRPALHAAIKALHWIAPRLRTGLVTSLDEALVRCRDALELVGVAAPHLSAHEFAGPD